MFIGPARGAGPEKNTGTDVACREHARWSFSENIGCIGRVPFAKELRQEALDDLVAMCRDSTRAPGVHAVGK
jgi:hypothetical protein